jgi:ketosteroid isomerase-like protein
MRTLIVITALVALAANVRAGNTPQENGIGQTAELYRKAVLAGDAKAVGATYRDDAVEMPPGREPVDGRTAIEQYYRGMFERMKVAEFTFTKMRTGSKGALGYATGVYRQRLVTAPGETIEDTGNFVVVASRGPEGWKSEYVIYNSHHAPAMSQGAWPSTVPSLLGSVDRWFTFMCDCLAVIGLLALAGMVVPFAWRNRSTMPECTESGRRFFSFLPRVARWRRTPVSSTSRV